LGSRVSAIETGVHTVRSAALLVADVLQESFITHLKSVPLFANETCRLHASALAPAPENAVQVVPPLSLRSHWYRRPVPVAATLKVAHAFSATVIESGWLTIATSKQLPTRTIFEVSVIVHAVTRHRNWTVLPVSAARTEKVYVAAVSPVRTVQELPELLLRHHWYAGDVPVAVTVKVAFSPTFARESLGSAVISGGVHTVRVAAELVAEVPHPLTRVTAHLNCAPLSVEAVVNE
jgi:hypothetical protein